MAVARLDSVNDEQEIIIKLVIEEKESSELRANRGCCHIHCLVVGSGEHEWLLCLLSWN